jgi:peptidoglycan/LPS O-acetylase OafA/YrhL
MLIEERENNFDFLRFFAATYVVIKHSFDLLKIKEDYFLRKITHTLEFGVPVFFVISGYLIYQSATKSNSWINYFWKRSLRIFPGLVACVLFVTFIVGPLLTSLPLSIYFQSAQTYCSLKTITIYKLCLHLPGVFESNPNSSTNGSLWTLRYEFTFYILLAVAIITKINRYRYLLLLLVLSYPIFIMILGKKVEYLNHSSIYLLKHNIKFFFEWGYYFLSGVVIFLFKDEFNKHKKVILVMVIILVFIMLSSTQFSSISFKYILPVSIFLFAYAPIGLSNFAKYGDFSYGMYIYAFPIQQSIIHITNANISVNGMILYSLVITLFFSVLSWHLVEKPFLKLKNAFQ